MTRNIKFNNTKLKYLKLINVGITDEFDPIARRRRQIMRRIVHVRNRGENRERDDNEEDEVEEEHEFIMMAMFEGMEEEAALERVERVRELERPMEIEAIEANGLPPLIHVPPPPRLERLRQRRQDGEEGIDAAAEQRRRRQDAEVRRRFEFRMVRHRHRLRGMRGMRDEEENGNGEPRREISDHSGFPQLRYLCLRVVFKIYYFFVVYHIRYIDKNGKDPRQLN